MEWTIAHAEKKPEKTYSKVLNSKNNKNVDKYITECNISNVQTLIPYFFSKLFK